MKFIASLICLLFISTSSFALQGSDCSAKSEKLPVSERKDFVKSCLAQAEAPANIQEEERKHKSATCEQNAKNKKLQGQDKATYISNCMNKNEAAALANAQPKHEVNAKSSSAATDNAKKKAPAKTTASKAPAKKHKAHKKEAKKVDTTAGSSEAK